MSETEQKTPQICSIKVTFPVETDEQAIQYKQAMTSVLATIPNAKIEFVLLSLPTSMGTPFLDNPVTPPRGMGEGRTE